MISTRNKVLNVLLPAVISAGVAVLGLFFTWDQAQRSALRTAQHDFATRQAELAVTVSKMISENKDAARRFAIGIIKFAPADANREQAGIVHYIPLNSRVTLGRDPKNDLILPDPDRYVSRFHFGLVSELEDVYIEDYLSRNGTWVNGLKIVPGQSQKLRAGDKITAGKFEMEFQPVHRSTILAK